VLLALAGWWLYFLRAAKVQSTVLTEPNGINQQVAVMHGYEEKFNRALADLKKVSAVSAPLEQTVEDRQFWAKIINELNTRLPEKYVWITMLQPTIGGKAVALGDPNRPLQSLGGFAPPSNAAVRRTGPEKGPEIDGILVQGLYLHNPSNNNVVVDFVKSLAASEYFHLDMRNQNSVILDNPPEDPKAWATPYKLQLTFKTPLPLP
jgi:Tfp pilus assembly protein PilN